MARQCPLSTYLSKSILSNGLESLFHVDRFLGAGLKVGDFVFGLTPLLRTPGGHGAVVKIYFVSEDNKGEVVGVSGAGLDINTYVKSTGSNIEMRAACLDQKLVSPAVE